MNVSDYIIEFLDKKGVDAAFMVAGGHAMYLNDALAKKKHKIDIICSLHEQGAAIAADAYGRLKNKPALLMITVGPAGLNALTGVAGAYTDSSPMIILSGQTNYHFAQYQHENPIRQYGLQSIDLEKISQGCVKFFATLESPQKTQEYIETAWIMATSGRPGPVWLEVPLDIQRAEIPQNIRPWVPRTSAFSQEHRVPQRDVDHFFKLLSKAKRPLIIAGGGVHTGQVKQELQRFTAEFNIPVVCSRMGIDLFERKYPLFIGSVGVNGERAAHFAIQNTDFLIVLGSRLTAPTTGHVPADFAKNAYKYAVDIDPQELVKPWVELDYAVQADIRTFLSAVLEKKATHDFSLWAEICAQWKKKYPLVLPEYKAQNPIHSYYAVELVSKYSSPTDIIVTDIGSCYHAVTHAWDVKGEQRILAQGALSTMGYWCAGIGASIADKSQNIIVFTGDGSLQMNLQELAVVKFHCLPLKIFVINNDGYLLIRTTQKNIVGSNFIGESPESGLWMPRAVDIAAVYGIKSYVIRTPEEAEEKIKAIMAENGPVICELMTNKWQVLQPKLASDKLPDGSLVAKPFEDLFPFLSPEELASNMLPPLERLK